MAWTHASGVRGHMAGAAEGYAALANGAGMADRSETGRLRIVGKDALDLLNRLSTNKLEALPPGHARLTVLASPNARPIDLLALGAVDGGMLCLTSVGRQQAAIDWLDTFTFGEEIVVEDVTAPTAQFALAGPRVPAALADIGLPALERDRLAPVTIADCPATLWRDASGLLWHVIAGAPQADAVWDALVAAGVTPAPPEAWEAFRVAIGLPMYGREFGDDTNPLESRLMGAISEDKGCYTGQEVIARLITYKKVQRRLMAATLSGQAAPGAALVADGQPAGVVTSVAPRPDGTMAALALVRVAKARPGHMLAVEGSSVIATLAEPRYALATEPPDVG
ncbi:MAG: hypothetical protein FJ318_07495 [SAR202 cluster bacterium]|nr:hypothetical protein [SAR202 cluster bacterium]